ncbi:DUF4839 domain-containing protein [Sanguibacter suarezii]|uniref:DUF4839 domain-containing protein n=1 Tax=Sanguibacter suarezii TaxID=60921 RepID=UPI000836128C|nr:DUF4839 domain-containing protein [Sanguibacter suarezii]
MADDVKYELKTVRTIRGTEARTTAKWEKDGWEFVTQNQGALQTQINFRRPKAKTPWRLLAVSGGGVLLLIILAVTIGAIQGEDDSPKPTTSPTESAVAPSEQPTVEPEPSEPAEEDVLTVENNEDLATLLAGPDQGPAVEEFAAKYKGRVIEFDGNIGAMAPHGDAKTRYDILISYGDYSETHSSGGPNFQFRDVNTTYDLHLTGANIPDSIGVGDNIRIAAQVGEFNADSLLFYLEPISTQFR